MGYRIAALFTAAATAFAVAGIPRAEASCGTSSCPLDIADHLSSAKSRRAKPGMHLQIAFERIDQDQPRYGTRKVDFGEILRPDHDEIATLNRNTRVQLQYRFRNSWSVHAELPVVSRRHAHLPKADHRHLDGDHNLQTSTAFGPARKVSQDDSGSQSDAEITTVERWDFTRVGDLSLRGALETPLPRRPRGPKVRLSLGLSLPTGSTAVKNEAGDRAEPTLQPGRGAYGLLLGVALYHHVRSPLLPRMPDALLLGSFSMRLNADGGKGFHFGSERLAHVGVHLPVSRRAKVLGQVTCHWSARHRPGRTGELTDATGGTEFLLSPGLEFSLLDDLTLYGYYQHPLYQDVNRVQITAAANLLVGLGYHLPLRP